MKKLKILGVVGKIRIGRKARKEDGKREDGGRGGVASPECLQMRGESSGEEGEQQMGEETRVTAESGEKKVQGEGGEGGVREDDGIGMKGDGRSGRSCPMVLTRQNSDFWV